MKYIARFSEHINEDLNRGWSSWNFGEEGLNATEEQLQQYKEQCIENGNPLHISGFELWGEQIADADIRELYEGYWVLVDNENFGVGISGIELKSDNLADAIAEAADLDYSGDGIKFTSEEVELVQSIDGEIHIFRVL